MGTLNQANNGSVGDLAFGESFNCLRDKANHPWVQMVFGFLQHVALLNACSRFSLLASILPYLIPRRIKKSMEDHWASTQAMLTKRIKKGTTRPDFLTPVLENNTSKGLTQKEIEANASLFMIAGSDSIATSLSGITWYLLKHPEVMKKLTDELDGFFEKEEELEMQRMDQLPYLMAVVDEGLRIYPVALAGQASIVPPEGDTVAGHHVPGNVSIVNPHSKQTV